MHNRVPDSIQNKDINDAFEDIFLGEEQCAEHSYEKGFRVGVASGNSEGYHLGYHRGAELGAELGYYLGVVDYYIPTDNASEKPSDKTIKQLTKVKELIVAFPRTNTDQIDILNLVETVRAQYKKLCAILKIDSFQRITLQLVQTRIMEILKYLTPNINFANCHMVDFITADHWNSFVPSALAEEVDKQGIDNAIDHFWKIMHIFRNEDYENDTLVDNNRYKNLKTFLEATDSYTLKSDGVLCLNVEQLENKLHVSGNGKQKKQKVTEFMSPKKSHEIEQMSWCVSSLFGECGSTYCVDIGGGKGDLSTALASQSVAVLTVDCSELKDGVKAKVRKDKLEKQWQKASKHLGKDVATHKHATVFVNSHTDLVQEVVNSFPGTPEKDIKLFLTGLHTCGNLGPDSLRLFINGDPRFFGGLCNVPCCYHLLTEYSEPTSRSWEVFCKNEEMNCNKREDSIGFPMSKYLKGFNLGLNARMLAAQSVDRVINLRQLPEQSLHYRAVLQVLLQRLGETDRLKNVRMKKISEKSDNLKTYLTAAAEKLKLNPDCIMKEFENLDSVFLEESNKKMNLFYLLRICLAQVVESLILLDRLLFLLEKGFTGIGDSDSGILNNKTFLVKLFDPVKSPRCHALVAIR